MKKLLSLSILICLAFLTLGAQSNHSQKNKGNNQEDRAEPKFIQELNANCKAILNNLPNPNDPKLVFPSSEKTQLSKLRAALSEGSSLPSNSKMPRVEKVLENISTALPKEGVGISAKKSKKQIAKEIIANCKTEGENCRNGCKPSDPDFNNCITACWSSYLTCLESLKGVLWMEAFEGRIKINEAPTTPPDTKGAGLQ